jgi:hypothetical protein
MICYAHIYIYNPWSQNLVQVMTGYSSMSHKILIYTTTKELQLNTYRLSVCLSVQNRVYNHHCILLFILGMNQQQIITDPQLCTFTPDISGLHRHLKAFHLHDTDVSTFNSTFINVCNETNLKHCLSSVYSVTIPLHVLGLPVAHHKEVTMCICHN